MALKDKKTFSDSEVAAAFELLMPADEAQREAKLFNSAPDRNDFGAASLREHRRSIAKGPRSYDGDFLDLMSLVSEDCAKRAWALLGVTVAEGRRRRATLKKRLRSGREQQKRGAKAEATNRTVR